MGDRMDDVDRELQATPLAEPPYYLCVRGPGGDVGYETLIADATSGGKSSVILLFSSSERARRILDTFLADSEGWAVGELTTWRMISDCLNAYPSLEYLCMDPERIPDPKAAVHDLSKVMPFIERLAERETGPA